MQCEHRVAADVVREATAKRRVLTCLYELLFL